MTISAVLVASDATAVLLAGSKLLKTAQPLWAVMPRWLAVALPVVVATLPALLSALSGVQTSADLVNVAVLGAALLVPGIKEAEAAPVPPPAA